MNMLLHGCFIKYIFFIQNHVFLFFTVGFVLLSQMTMNKKINLLGDQTSLSTYCLMWSNMNIHVNILLCDQINNGNLKIQCLLMLDEKSFVVLQANS